jgi:hypothetical protein
MNSTDWIDLGTVGRSLLLRFFYENYDSTIEIFRDRPLSVLATAGWSIAWGSWHHRNRPAGEAVFKPGERQVQYWTSFTQAIRGDKPSLGRSLWHDHLHPWSAMRLSIAPKHIFNYRAIFTSKTLGALVRIFRHRQLGWMEAFINPSRWTGSPSTTVLL